MGTDTQSADAALRSQFFDKSVKQVAERMYKFKQSLTIVSTSAWKNYFYREALGVLSDPAGNSVTGIPRGAAFPQATASWERVQVNLSKYGIEEFIFWEDIRTDDIDVRNRTIYKLAERVTKSVDDAIWTALEGDKTAGSLPSSIQSFSVVGLEWNETSSAILDNLNRAKQLIAEQNYPTENLECWVSPRDYRSIMKWLGDKGTQWPVVGQEMATNGRMGKIGGVQLVMSMSVTASNALVVVPKVCATWKSNLDLTTETIDDPLLGVKVRCAEVGVTELTDPQSVVLIYGTQSGRA